MNKALLGLLVIVTLSACERPRTAEATPMPHDMLLESPAFANGTPIPSKYTCEGDDPDAPDPRRPQRTWVHWVLYEIPADATGLPERGKPLPPGTREGTNDWESTGYGGPCPPVGEHRYFFKLYALDAALGDLYEPSKDQLEDAMTGHILGKVELMGTYEKATPRRR
jgi:Raf kinase inhibitor-like YbhB/YbcL family protein